MSITDTCICNWCNVRFLLKRLTECNVCPWSNAQDSLLLAWQCTQHHPKHHLLPEIPLSILVKNRVKYWRCIEKLCGFTHTLEGSYLTCSLSYFRICIFDRVCHSWIWHNLRSFFNVHTLVAESEHSVSLDVGPPMLLFWYMSNVTPPLSVICKKQHVICVT